jgi:CO/xanthine dehydrogenase FAD-binding subunit
MNDRQADAFWTVDPDASLQSLLDDPDCPKLLSRVLKTVHSWQLRSETTVGRTLRASQLMPQWTAALLALGARVTVEDEDGAREVDLEALVQRQARGDVTALHVPQRADSGWGEAHVARTPSDDPIVAAHAVVRADGGVVEEARITLTGVSSDPVWIAAASSPLVGQRLDDDQIAAVAAAVRDEVEPEGDYLGGADYRRAMAGVLTRRALEACVVSLTEGDGDE